MLQLSIHLISWNDVNCVLKHVLQILHFCAFDLFFANDKKSLIVPPPLAPSFSFGPLFIFPLSLEIPLLHSVKCFLAY